MMKVKVPQTLVKKCSNFYNGDFYTYIKNKYPGLLPFRDRLYVLVPDGPAHNWCPFMNESQYETYIKYGFVIAFAFVERINGGMANLIWLETRIPGHGFATYLRRHLRHTFTDVLPTFIPKESAHYWSKELGYDYEREEGYTLDEYMSQLCGELKPYFNWGALAYT
jgi:hypothetical protein